MGGQRIFSFENLSKSTKDMEPLKNTDDSRKDYNNKRKNRIQIEVQEWKNPFACIQWRNERPDKGKGRYQRPIYCQMESSLCQNAEWFQPTISLEIKVREWNVLYENVTVKDSPLRWYKEPFHRRTSTAGDIVHWKHSSFLHRQLCDCTIVMQSWPNPADEKCIIFCRTFYYKYVHNSN